MRCESVRCEGVTHRSVLSSSCVSELSAVYSGDL